MNMSPGSVADATGNWVDTLAPAWSRPYLRLARLPLGLLINFHGATLKAGLRRFRFSAPSLPSVPSTPKIRR